MNKNQLKKQILQKELQIKKLHLHESSNDVCNQLYNSLILEKAILKKELENLEKNLLIDNLKDRVVRLFTPQKKMICDYWKK